MSLKFSSTTRRSGRPVPARWRGRIGRTVGLVVVTVVGGVLVETATPVWDLQRRVVQPEKATLHLPHARGDTYGGGTWDRERVQIDHTHLTIVRHYSRGFWPDSVGGDRAELRAPLTDTLVVTLRPTRACASGTLQQRAATLRRTCGDTTWTYVQRRPAWWGLPATIWRLMGGGPP